MENARAPPHRRSGWEDAMRAQIPIVIAKRGCRSAAALITSGMGSTITSDGLDLSALVRSRSIQEQ